MSRILITILLLSSTPHTADAGQCSETYTDSNGVKRRRPVACDGSGEPKPAPRKGEKKDPVAK